MPPHEQQSHVRHELRAPLAVMFPALAMLLNGTAGDLTPRQLEYLELLERNADRLERLVAGFADSGWLDCAAAPPHAVATALPALVEGVVRPFRQRWPQGPSVRVDYSPEAPPAVVDREHAGQIVANLLDNAMRYTPSDGSVTVAVSAGRVPDRVRLTITDTGAGIAAAELRHVFEFGFRGAAADAAPPPGLGIGLSVSRELAERNGGSVSLASQPGVGTTAVLELPAG